MAAPDALSNDQFGFMAGYAKNLTRAGLNPSKAAPKSRASGMAGNYNNLRTNMHRGMATAAFNADPTGGNMTSNTESMDMGSYFGHPSQWAGMPKPASAQGAASKAGAAGKRSGKNMFGKIKGHVSKYAGNLATELKRQTGSA